MTREVRVSEAAKILSLSNLSVQNAMRLGKLPIGEAWINEGSTCWTYHITAKALGDYIGATKGEVLEMVREIRQNN